MPTPAVKPAYENVFQINVKKQDYTKRPFQSKEDKYITPATNERGFERTDPVEETVLPSVPPHLRDIIKTIESSRDILSYKDDWDGNGALPINPVIFERVSSFLIGYADRIYDVCKKHLLLPEIVPVNDGSIDIEWNLHNSNFLINFKNTPEEIAFYYGEFKDGNEVTFDTNGQINTSTVKDKFASYLSDLS